MRIIFDVSLSTRFAGPPGGLSRVEIEFALYAWAHLPEVEFSFFDFSRGCFRRLKREWVPDAIGPDAILDVSHMSTPNKWGGLMRLPSNARLRGAVAAVRSPRRSLVTALERRRLAAGSPAVRHAARRVLERLDGGAQRVAVLPEDIALDGAFDLDRECVLVSAGNDWSYKDMDRIAALKARHGFRYVVLCHDLILVQFPELISPANAEKVRNYWRKTFPVADRMIFTSRRVERDVQEYRARHDLPPGESALVPLGSNPGRFQAASQPALPAGLKPERYALMVGGIAPRKGHEMLIRVWNRLFDEGVPQAHGFRLVLAGKLGRGMHAVQRLLAERKSGDTLLHLADVDDALLGALYRNCAFTLMPSLYEGFGLPIVESLSFGKPVIASNGGSLPEVVAGFSPCLDPRDEDAWLNAIRAWIVDPADRERFAERIAREYRTRSWDEAAAEFFAAAGAKFR